MGQNIWMSYYIYSKASKRISANIPFPKGKINNHNNKVYKYLSSSQIFMRYMKSIKSQITPINIKIDIVELIQTTCNPMSDIK